MYGELAIRPIGGSQYAHTPMSVEQRDVLNTALQRLHKRQYRGITVTWAHVEYDRYTPSVTAKVGGSGEGRSNSWCHVDVGHEW